MALPHFWRASITARLTASMRWEYHIIAKRFLQPQNMNSSNASLNSVSADYASIMVNAKNSQCHQCHQCKRKSLSAPLRTMGFRRERAIQLKGIFICDLWTMMALRVCEHSPSTAISLETRKSVRLRIPGPPLTQTAQQRDWGSRWSGADGLRPTIVQWH